MSPASRSSRGPKPIPWTQSTEVNSSWPALSCSLRRAAYLCVHSKTHGLQRLDSLLGLRAKNSVGVEVYGFLVRLHSARRNDRNQFIPILFELHRIHQSRS